MTLTGIVHTRHRAPGHQGWFAEFDANYPGRPDPITVCTHDHRCQIGDTISVTTNTPRDPVTHISVNGRTIFDRKATSQ